MEQLNLESQMYKLYELRTELDKGIDNYKKLQKQYESLIDIVESSNRQDELPEDFIQGIVDYKTQLETALEKMVPRLGYINLLIGKYEDGDAEIEGLITLFFNALGIEGSSQHESAE